MIKLFLKDPIVTIAQILSIFYSFFIFIFTILSVIGFPFFGSGTSELRPESLFFAVVWLFYLIFPLYLFRKRMRGKTPKLMEYLIVLMAFSPVTIFIISSFITFFS